MVNMASNTPQDVNPLRRLTNDSATYSEPAISPDGSRIAVVRNDENGPAPGPDIVVIDIETLTQTSLTTDLGTFVESSPRWSPDGQQIVYAAAAATEPGNNDIAVRASAGFGLPTLLVRDPANDIRPVFSPDGRMLAFASDRGGQYDIYILDIGTQTLSQLTNTPQEDYPGGWWQPGQ
jgi:TolB protein